MTMDAPPPQSKGLRAIHISQPSAADVQDGSKLHPAPSQGQGFLSLDDFKDCFQRIIEEGRAPRITGGELLAHPELKQLVLYLREQSVEWLLDTDGTRLSHMKVARALRSSGLSATRVALHGPDAGVHDAILGLSGAFDATVAGIRNLNTLGVPVTLSVVLGQGNIRRLNDIVALADSLGSALSFRWPRQGQLNIPEGARSVRNAFSRAMVGHGWPKGRFEVVDIPRCLAPEALLVIRGSEALESPEAPQCNGCAQAGNCPGPTQVQIDEGISEHLRPEFPDPQGYRFEEEPSGVVEIPDFKACGVRKLRGEAPPIEDILIPTDKEDSFEHYAAENPGDAGAGLWKNLIGYAADPRDPEKVLVLDDSCRSCRMLTKCAAVFRPEEQAPLPMDRDRDRVPAKAKVLECETSEELSSALLQRLREGDNRGVVRGRIPVSGAGKQRGISPNDFFRAILGQPWKVDEVRLPDKGSKGTFEVALTATKGAGSAGLHNLAAVALLKRCNLRCIMCQIPVLYPESDVPPMDLFRTFFELRLHGFDWLTTFGGEPLLRRDLEALIASARMLGFGVDMVTNGSYLDEERSKSLVEAGLNFCMVSVDGATADTHDVVRAKVGSFDEAVTGLKNFRTQAPDTRIELNSVIVQENKHQLQDLVELVDDLDVKRANLFLCVSAPVLAPEPHWLDVPSLATILREELPALRSGAQSKGIELTLSPGFPEGRLDEFIEEAAKGVYNLYYQSGTRCQAPDKEIFISVKQEVYGCASPTVLESGTALGTLNDQSLGSIYRSQDARFYSDSAADHDPCKMCWRCDPESKGGPA